MTVPLSKNSQPFKPYPLIKYTTKQQNYKLEILKWHQEIQTHIQVLLGSPNSNLSVSLTLPAETFTVFLVHGHIVMISDSCHLLLLLKLTLQQSGKQQLAHHTYWESRSGAKLGGRLKFKLRLEKQIWSRRTCSIYAEQ